MADESVWTTLRVENIPIGSTDSQLEDLFCDFGPIRRCFVVKPKKAGAKKTIGYVQFSACDDAKSALEAVQNKGLTLQGQDIKAKAAPDKNEGPKVDNGEFEEKRAQREFDRQAAKAKKARLIVRNLSFKATDETLKEHFASMGLATKAKQRDVVDVNILKKPDGKMVGCGFVQFRSVSEAADAIKKLNGKPYLNRPVAVDWAVSKRDFKREDAAADEVKEEPVEDDVDMKEEVKEEAVDVKEEPADAEVKEESDEDSDDDSEEGESDEDEGEDGAGEAKRERKDWPKTGHDLAENRTVFIRNLSFESDEEDLKAMLQENFGRVLFARFVMDRATNHPKGTAFVKFEKAEYAADCTKVSDGPEGIFLDGRRIYCIEAITKDKADETVKEKKEKRAKDTRNLYLAREGLVREGTLAAEGVSKQDMAKRAQLNRWKKGVLKDLNMFVSPLRLCVRNLPLQVTDKSLRLLINKHCDDGDKKAEVTECKIMRDLKSVSAAAGDKKGEAPSKGYGFVTFADHTAALNALRKLNNNPNVFKKDQRPIVEFSIENRKALLARQKRLEKSIEKNPLAASKKAAGGKKKASVLPAHEKPTDKEVLDDRAAFMGAPNNPKVKGLPTHEGPKIRHEKRDKGAISRKDLRKQEQERKNPKLRRKRQRQRSEAAAAAAGEENGAEDGPSEAKKAKKKNKKKVKSKEEIKDLRDDSKFNDMVNKYKQKLQTGSSNVAVKSKWFS